MSILSHMFYVKIDKAVSITEKEIKREGEILTKSEIRITCLETRIDLKLHLESCFSFYALRLGN